MGGKGKLLWLIAARSARDGQALTAHPVHQTGELILAESQFSTSAQTQEEPGMEMQ